MTPEIFFSVRRVTLLEEVVVVGTTAIPNDAFAADFEKGAEENWVAFLQVYVAAPVSRG